MRASAYLVGACVLSLLPQAGCDRRAAASAEAVSRVAPIAAARIAAPASREKYRARCAAVEARPDSNDALGALAVFLHANDFTIEAAPLYERLVARDPKEARWPYLLARIRLDEGQNQNARDLLEAAATRAPDYALIDLRRAELALKTGNSAEAVAFFEKYLTRAPADGHALLGLGRIAMQRGDWRAAEEKLTAALRSESVEPAARALLVTVHEAKGETALAARARGTPGPARRFREPADPWIDALADECGDVEKLSVLADIALETGRHARAIALLERARALAPDRARTAFELGAALVQSGDRHAGIARLREAVRVQPTLEPAQHALVAALEAAGDASAALAASELAVHQLPGSAGLQRQYGILLQAAGRSGQALAVLQRAVGLDPGDVRNIEALANLHWATGQKDAAVGHYEKVRALSPVAAKARALLGQHYLAQQQLDAAAACLEEAFAVEPQLDGLDVARAHVHLRRGNAFFRAQNLPEAERAFLRALEAKVDHEESVTGLVAVWMRTARLAEARAKLTKLIESQPRALFAYALAARVAAQAGDLATAEALIVQGLARAGEQNDAAQTRALRELQARVRTRSAAP